MQRKLLLLVLLSYIVGTANAYEKRDLLAQCCDISKLKSSLVLNQKWVTYPKYSDRAGWDSLTIGNKEEIIKKGESALSYQWQVIKATDYLEFERSGSRKTMETPYAANNQAIADLVLAELAEGKGRFMNQIVNGVWLYCEMTSWSLSAHIRGAQNESTSLPSYKESIIDLSSGDMSGFFAWTYYFLKPEMDKIQPMVSQRLRQNLQTRILDTFTTRNDFWWMATNATPTTMVNNWNPWCNSNVLLCFLLLENDRDKLAEAVYKSMVSVDKFINYYHSDGACEEGPSYWGHAAGKLYDYLQLLNNATNSKVSVFNQPIIKNMGEYIVNAYVGNDWVVNFADASAKGKLDQGLIYRYGKAVNSQKMMSFAAQLFNEKKTGFEYNAGRDLFRSLENLSIRNELKKTKPVFEQNVYKWYPETEVCYMRNKNGFFVAAKGGYNAESHNHNDMGSFILYIDQTPMIIDAGVGIYTRQTFSNERYSIWSMQSNYHNLPIINGVAQKDGAKFRSRSVSFIPESLTFSLDLANAYPKDAAVKNWIRTFQLASKGGLSMTESVSLDALKSNNLLNYLTWTEPNIDTKGVVTILKDGVKLTINYNSNQLDPIVEVINIVDKNLVTVWGEKIYRLSLKAKEMKLKDKYILTFNR